LLHDRFFIVFELLFVGFEACERLQEILPLFSCAFFHFF
jgi:hypothetical protein